MANWKKINRDVQVLNNLFPNWVNVSSGVRSFGAYVRAVGNAKNKNR